MAWLNNVLYKIGRINKKLLSFYKDFFQAIGEPTLKFDAVALVLGLELSTEALAVLEFLLDKSLLQLPSGR